MTVSRRQFLMSAGATALIAARGHEAWAQSAVQNATDATFLPNHSQGLILNSNENPMGPGQHVIDAVLSALGDDGAGAGRYVFAQQATTRAAIADSFSVEPDNILLGAGSTELIRLAVESYTSAERPLVTAVPSFAAGERYAELLKHPVKKIPLTESLHIDLDAMLHASDDAGLLYLCNPNNPTATALSNADIKTFISRISSRSPDTVILIDEAYYDYVVDADYESMLNLSTKHPQLIVARTFSKAYGMAGLRLGYLAGHAETIEKMSQVRGMDMYTSYPARAGLISALGNAEQIERERARNLDVRRFTQAYLSTAGVQNTASQTNFIFFDCGQSSENFQQSCQTHGVRIRAGYADYPTHVRVSLGTIDEMQYATDIFTKVL